MQTFGWQPCLGSRVQTSGDFYMPSDANCWMTAMLDPVCGLLVTIGRLRVQFHFFSRYARTKLQSRPSAMMCAVLTSSPGKYNGPARPSAQGPRAPDPRAPDRRESRTCSILYATTQKCVCTSIKFNCSSCNLELRSSESCTNSLFDSKRELSRF